MKMNGNEKVPGYFARMTDADFAAIERSICAVD